MAMKITLEIDGKPVTVEADFPAQAVAAAQALMKGGIFVPPQVAQASQRVGTPAPSPPAPEAGNDDEASRSPRGHNRKLALQALAYFGAKGAFQAHVQKWIRREKGEVIAVSSTRHALKQLYKLGQATRNGDTWFITGDGIRELAKLEAA